MFFLSLLDFFLAAVRLKLAISSLGVSAGCRASNFSLGFPADLPSLAFLFLLSFVADELLVVDSEPLELDREVLGLLALFLKAFECPRRLVLRLLGLCLVSF